MNKILGALPNALSLFRVLVAPVFVVCIRNNESLLALLVLILGAISDFLDGNIARRFKLESHLGELLDPLGDKVLVNTVLWGIYTSYHPALPVLVLAIISTLRDVVLLLGSGFILAKKISLPTKPIVLSKVCTFLVFLYAILVLLFERKSLFDMLGYLCVALVLITFLIYSLRFVRSYRHANNASRL